MEENTAASAIESKAVNTSRDDDSQLVGEKKVATTDVKTSRGVEKKETLQAEGNKAYKKIIAEKLLQKAKEANERAEVGNVSIRFNDAQSGREVYSFEEVGVRGKIRIKAISIVLSKGVSLEKYPMKLAKQMVKFFEGRAEIV